MGCGGSVATKSESSREGSVMVPGSVMPEAIR